MNRLPFALLTLFILLVCLPVMPVNATSLQGLGEELSVTQMQQGAPVAAACGDPGCSNCGGSNNGSQGNNVGRGLGKIFGSIFQAFGALFEEIIKGFREGFADIFGGGNNFPPVTPPVQPPVTPPVQPPVMPPVQPPVTPPVQPPTVEPPVTPPVAPPTTTPTGTTPTGVTEYPKTSQELVQLMKDKYGVTNTGYFDYQRLKYNYDCLAILPDCFRKRTTQINHTSQGGNIAGYVYIPETKVNLTRSTSRRGTLVHEMAHTWQGGNMKTTEDWAQQFWGTRSVRTGRYQKNGRRSVSNYGNTNPLEDMAESVMHYVFYPDKMKTSHPDRYAFVKSKIMGGVEYTGNEYTDWKN